MAGKHEASWSYRVKIPVIAKVFQPLPNLLITASITLSSFLDQVLEIVFKPMDGQASCCWMELCKDLSLEFLLSKIAFTYTFAESFELTKGKLLV